MRILIESPDGAERHLVDQEALDQPEYEGWVELPDAAAALELSLIKDRLIARLKGLRDQSEFGTVTTPQGVLQIDERSQGRMQRALELGRTFEKLTGQTFATAWRMFDNSEVPIGIAQLEGWSLLIGAQVQHVFSRYGALYAQIMAATSVEQLDAVDIEGGWDVGAA
jgi:hypothetical protein